MTRFRASLPHELDGFKPRKEDVATYVERVKALGAEVERLRTERGIQELRGNMAEEVAGELEVENARLRDDNARLREARDGLWTALEDLHHYCNFIREYDNSPLQTRVRAALTPKEDPK